MISAKENSNEIKNIIYLNTNKEDDDFNNKLIKEIEIIKNHLKEKIILASSKR